MTSSFYHQGHRELQDQFESRRIADRLESISSLTFSEGDRALIEGSIFFFLATADQHGQPDCSFKGGPAGFVRLTGPSELAFPDYDGNGMFRSLGNIMVNHTWPCCSSRWMAHRIDYECWALPWCGATIRSSGRRWGRS